MVTCNGVTKADKAITNGSKDRKKNSAKKGTVNTSKEDINNMKRSDQHDKPDADLSIELPYTNSWETSLEDMKSFLLGKIDGLMMALESKDKQISLLSEKVGQMSTEIEQLKNGVNFISNETSELKDKFTTDTVQAGKKIESLELKTHDLEDRSRRCNLVIFGVPEVSHNSEENCDKKVCGILANYGILDKKDAHEGLLERAHRLGRKKHEATRPRPIIVCCGSFKDKQYIIDNSKKLKGSPYFIAEDFSRATLEIRRKLVQKGNDAKEKCPSVKSFSVKYKRLVLNYQNPNTNKFFTWGFDLKDTEGSSQWFEHPIKNHQHRVQNQTSTFKNQDGYQGHR